MKPSHLLSTVTLLLLTLTTVLHAADNAAHKQQVETLFRLTQMEKMIQDSVDSVVQLQLRQSPNLGQHEQAVREFFTKYIGWNALKNDVTEMYLTTFDEKELEQINAFYITPAGQKVITAVPKLVQQRNQLAMHRLEQNIGELQQIIAQPPAATAPTAAPAATATP